VHEYRVQLQATSLCQTNEKVWNSAHLVTSLLILLLYYIRICRGEYASPYQMAGAQFQL